MKQKKARLLPAEARKILEEDFRQLEDPVTILVFTDEKENLPFSEFSMDLLGELSEIAPKINPKFEKIGGELSKKYDVSRPPTLLIQPEKYGIRLTGAPSGEEIRTLMISILMASTGKTILSDAARQRLAQLKDKRNVKVFVSPTCPYCPSQAAMAVAAAVERPGMVAVEIIEIYENKEIAAQFNAVSVPQSFIDDQLVGMGLQPEEAFVEQIITAAPIKAGPYELAETIEKDLVIVGAGPSGLTAAIYAERSGLRSVVLEKANVGGQVAVTPFVENYPAFTKIGGKALMDMMAQQANTYTDIHDGEEVIDVARSDGLFEIKTTRTKYIAKAILLATGAESKKLEVPGEAAFQGKGISYCAACDGYFFKDGKKVIVVGGGNTAATEALYLKNIGVDVALVHRKDKLRAEMFLQKSLADNKIPIIWNTVVKEIKGQRLVTGVVLENTKDKSQSTMQIDGVFIAIGYVPNNELAKKLGIETDQEGYVKVGEGHRTNMRGVYAAGDITGGFKQIVTAVGQGAIAANAIFEDISNPYWKEKSANSP
jgi:thioredoxin reductase (NADPH)